MNILQNIHNYDLTTFDWCLRRKHRQMWIKLARLISKTADGQLYVVVGIVLLSAGLYTALKVCLAAFAVERAIYFVTKNLFKRDRPPQAIPGFKSIVQPSDQFSFPSGHSSAAFMMATIGSIFVPAAIIPLFVWATFVAFSRVLLGVHFPTDTLAGATLGASVAVTSLNYFGVL